MRQPYSNNVWRTLMRSVHKIDHRKITNALRRTVKAGELRLNVSNTPTAVHDAGIVTRMCNQLHRDGGIDIPLNERVYRCHTSTKQDRELLRFLRT
jgi:hypothetical protein